MDVLGIDSRKSARSDDNVSSLKSVFRLKKMYKLARTVHVYVSMLLLSLLIFFCITGFFLNHSEWFEGRYVEQVQDLKLRPALAEKLADMDSLERAPIDALRQMLKKEFGLNALHEIHFDPDMGELAFDFQIPAGYASAYFTADGDASLEFRKGSLIGVLNDLHKGRHSGIVWSWVMDISALLITVFAVSGLVILVQNKKYRLGGLALGLAGSVMPVILYWFWVPGISGV